MDTLLQDLRFVPLGVGAPVTDFSIEGRTPVPNAVEDAELFTVSPGYFQALGIPLRSGRLFEPQDGPSSQRVALINEALARRYLPGRDPLGARVSLDGQDWFTVVGIVGDVRNAALQQEPHAQLYMPFTQLTRRAMFLAVRTMGEPTGLVGAAGVLSRTPRRRVSFQRAGSRLDVVDQHADAADQLEAHQGTDAEEEVGVIGVLSAEHGVSPEGVPHARIPSLRKAQASTARRSAGHPAQGHHGKSRALARLCEARRFAPGIHLARSGTFRPKSPAKPTPG